MSAALIWGYVHILMLVFWLGADVGVFTAARMSTNPSRSFEARSALLQVAMIVDILPRLMFAIALPVGLQLTDALGMYPIPTWELVGAWILAAAWSALIVTVFLREGSVLATRLASVQLGAELLLGLVIGGVGLQSLLGNGPIGEAWLAAKIALLGLLFFIAIALELAFRPALAPFMEIGSEGSTPQREQRYTTAVNRALLVVIVLYTVLAAAAFLGKVKPF